MSCSTLVLKFLVDVYDKTVEYNSAGQAVNEWTKTATISCDFMPSRAEERLVGRLQNPVSYNIWVDGHANIEVDQQFRDLRDADGNIIEAGPFNVVGVRKYRGWNSISHQTINAQKILQ